MSDAAKAGTPEGRGDAPGGDTVRAETIRARRRGRNLALLAALAAFVLIVYIVTIVKFDLAAG